MPNFEKYTNLFNLYIVSAGDPSLLCVNIYAYSFNWTGSGFTIRICAFVLQNGAEKNEYWIYG